MLDIKFVRENPEIVKENIRKKFQDNKLPLVDEVLELDKENRFIKQEVEALRAERNKLSKQIGGLMAKAATMRTSQARVTSHPPPNATPLTAAMTGLEQFSMLSMACLA